MHWFLKVTLIFIHYAVNSNCLPIRSHSEYPLSNLKGYRPGYSYNRSDGLRNNLHGTLQDKSRYQKSLLDQSRRGIGSSLADVVQRLTRTLPDRTANRRDIDIGINLKNPVTTKYQSGLDKLENILEQALEGTLTQTNISECPSCDDEVFIKYTVKPAFKCDEWNSKHRVCILERNIGDTVTFYLSTGKPEKLRQPNVTWMKEFHIRDSKQRKQFVVEHDNPPENMIIGRRGYELRISPITETDMEYNMFSATLKQSYASALNKVYFMIRIVPIDLGFVYVGETIELNLRKYVSLPEQSMSFKWYMEKDGEHGTLPSNMKVSITGSSIKISELRQEQEGILACSVYTNLHFLATKKRFLIKDLVKNKDVLQSSPDHTLIFKEEPARLRIKRNAGSSLTVLPSPKLLRQKREKNLADEIERALMEPSPTEKQIFSYTTEDIPIRPYDYNPEMGQRQEPDMFETNDNRFPEISDDAEDVNDLPKQIDISIEKGQMGVEEPVEAKRAEYNNRPSMPEDVPLQRGYVNAPVKNQKADAYNRNKFISSEVFPGSKTLQGRPIMYQNQNPQLPMKKTYQKGPQIIDLDIDTKKAPPVKDDFSDVVLNIDRIPTPQRIPAEEKIAKLISSCYSDFECSVTASCVRSSLKKAGFCKCLPGSNGVGIFCREEIWLSNSNFEMDEHSSDYMAYAGAPPVQ